MSDPPYGTKIVKHTDGFGRTSQYLVPLGSSDGDADRGLLLGPPDLKPLGLPHQVEIKLHNALEARGIITTRDAADRPGEIVSALQAAFKATAQSVQALYLGD